MWSQSSGCKLQPVFFRLVNILKLTYVIKIWIVVGQNPTFHMHIEEVGHNWNSLWLKGITGMVTYFAQQTVMSGIAFFKMQPVFLIVNRTAFLKKNDFFCLLKSWQWLVLRTTASYSTFSIFTQGKRSQRNPFPFANMFPPPLKYL